MHNIPEDSTQKAKRSSAARHLDLNRLMKVHFTGGGEMNEARGRLLALFLVEKPYLLAYDYRKKSSDYKQDIPVLAMLVREGLIVQVEKTAKKITFRYVGPEPAGA